MAILRRERLAGLNATACVGAKVVLTPVLLLVAVGMLALRGLDRLPPARAAASTAGWS
jgi:hypothetical protein